jgi:hypothetical protein
MSTAPKTTAQVLWELRKWGDSAARKLRAEEDRQADLAPNTPRPDRWQALGAENAMRLQNIGRLLMIDPVEREIMLQDTLRLSQEPWRNFGVLSAFDVVAQTARLAAH